MDRLTDERLMELLNRGDTSALDELYRRYARKVYVFFRSAGGLSSHQDSEDAVHDVFMRVIRGVDTFDSSKASFRTWISRIARNHLIDVMRRGDRARMVTLVGASEKKDHPSDTISEDAVPDPGESAEASLIRGTIAEAVRDCMSELENPDERQAIILYYLYEKVYREIAEILGESTSMARNRIKSAQARVRKCLERKGVTDW